MAGREAMLRASPIVRPSTQELRMRIAVLRPVTLVLVVMAAAACSFDRLRGGVTGSGNPAEEMRDVAGVHSVSFALPGTLYVEQGDAETLRIEADDNLLPHIVTRVRDGELEIGTDSRRLAPGAPLRVHLTVRELRALRGAGSGRIEAPGLRVPSLTLAIAGSGGAYLPDLHAEELTVQIAGSGDVEISGWTLRHELSIAGSGDIEARDLASAELSANIAGSGNAHVQVSERITANLIGSGSVRYFGDPQVSSNTVGSGRVVRAQN
jgi:hypothetical protein